MAKTDDRTAKAWLEKYYPTSAGECSKEDAIAHTLRKWEGAKASVLRHHRLRFTDTGLFSQESSRLMLAFGCASCALCHHYCGKVGARCSDCPLRDMLGAECYRSGQPYCIFWRTGDPWPMIRALRRLAKKEKRNV